MGACWDDRSKWEIYNEKIHKHAHSVQNSKVIRTCLARGKIFENVGFFKETRQNPPLTLTSTLHHDIFTYLDYIFSCNLHIFVCVCVSFCIQDLLLDNLQGLICHTTLPTIFFNANMQMWFSWVIHLIVTENVFWNSFSSYFFWNPLI